MSIFDLISISLKNIIRGKLRTILTVLAISIGIASVILLTVIGASGKKMINDKLEKIGLDGIMIFSGEYDGLTPADGERIRKRVSEVALSMPFATSVGHYSVYDSSPFTALILGVDSNLPNFMSLDIMHGRIFTETECSSAKKVCVVDDKFALEEFKRTNVVGKTVNLTNGNVREEFEIIGVADSSLSDITGLIGIKIPFFIYVPYAALGYDEDTSIGQLALKVKKSEDPSAVKSKVVSVLKKTNSNGRYFQVENISEYRNEFDYILSIVTLVLSVTATISLLVAGIGIMNSMLATVNDRRVEIGICKAIGASKGQIAVIFLCESIILSLIGGICGATAGFLITFIAGCVFGITPEISLFGILMPSAITIFTGLSSGLMPAIKAAKLMPVAAIRKE